jgi:tRNA (mo5U34)-methyltransferase
MLGLIYHLENPVGALHTARRHTRRVYVVETQLAPPRCSVIDWGSNWNRKEIVATFAVVDEVAEVDDANREATVADISLVPDLDGLLFLMGAVGFDRVEVVHPNRLNEQLADGKCAMIAGFIDG